MKLGELEFKAEDFEEYFEGAICIGAAIRANKLLHERLAKAQVVYGQAEFANWHQTTADESDTHTARLICIEEIGELPPKFCCAQHNCFTVMCDSCFETVLSKNLGGFMNNKGITLLEVLLASVLMCMLAWGFNTMIISFVKQSKQVTNKVNAALAKGVAGKYTTIYLNDNKCHQADSKYWVMEYNTNTVMVYWDSGCTQAIGTLGALANDTFFDDVGQTMWVVSVYPGTLRMLVTDLTKP